MKISAHVVTYSGMLAVGTLVAYCISYSFGKDDKAKQQELDEIYSPKQHKVPGNRQIGANHDEMQKFFDKLKKPEHGEIDHKLDDLMKKGRGEMKRHHNYDTADPSPASSSADKKNE